MASLLIPTRQAVQPQGRVEIDWSNPLTRDLLSLAVVSEGKVRELVSGTLLAPAGTTSVRGGSKGMAAVTSSGATDAFSASIPNIDLSTKPAATVFAWSRTYTSATGQKRPISYITTGTNSVISLSFGTNSNGFIVGQKQSSSSTFPQVDAGYAANTERPYFLAYTVATSASTGALYLNGSRASGGTASGTGTGWKGIVNAMAVGGHGTAYPLNGEFWIGGLFGRELSPAEMRSLADNPYQLCRPAHKRLFFFQRGGLFEFSGTGAAFALVGGDADLTYTPTVIYDLSAGTGSFTISGGNAEMEAAPEDGNGRMIGHVGSFIIGGHDADLSYTPSGGWRSVNPAAASWTRIR